MANEEKADSKEGSVSPMRRKDQILLDLNRQQLRCVDELVKTGLYGANRDEAVERLISERLLDLINNELLDMP